MEKQKTSNKESFQKIQKYKAVIGVLSVVSVLLAFTSLNLYSQIENESQSFAEVEGIAIENNHFVPGSRMGGGGTKVITDRFTPVLEQLVDSDDISQEQRDLILDTLESYDPFN